MKALPFLPLISAVGIATAAVFNAEAAIVGFITLGLMTIAFSDYAKERKSVRVTAAAAAVSTDGKRNHVFPLAA